MPWQAYGRRDWEVGEARLVKGIWAMDWVLPRVKEYGWGILICTGTIVYSLPASRGTGRLRYSNSLEPLRELETVRIKLVQDFIDEPMSVAKFPHPLYCRLHLPRAWCGFDPWSEDWDAMCFPAKTKNKNKNPETIKQRQCCSKFKAILEDKTSAKPSSPHLLDYIYYSPQPHKFPDPRSGLLFSSFIYLFVRLSGSFLSWCQAQERWNK